MHVSHFTDKPGPEILSEVVSRAKHEDRDAEGLVSAGAPPPPGSATSSASAIQIFPI